ncbi:S8 family serine peptidase [Polaribacter porphyrae]|uniref:Peptidase S8/S53 domain-containing protein n=1 Tax=Polaribacter porphyrae TaxID=1137780 RepID=A0A2S7WPZ7_9FLAO|nr:S8 family serine peptidase [Polaribacter porphyrae]PQJ79688.1 hypothetical protein BTO18_11110 [Polaribacter porphyrae]
MKRYLYLILLIIFFYCSDKNKHYHPIKFNQKFNSTKELNEVESKIWFTKDVLLDSIPGISLNRAYDSLLSNIKVKKEIIVAVLDTEIDINHEDLEGKFWVNLDEIPNNGIDDDNNGYIDDLNGWNFIGNSKGKNIIYSSLECVRIIQLFSEKFADKKQDEIAESQKKEFQTYQDAIKYYNQKLKVIQADKEYADFLYNGYPAAKKALKHIFPKENYNTKSLDSLYNLYKIENKKLANHAYFLSDFIKYDLSEEWINNYRKGVINKIDKTYNLDYFDRLDIDSFPNNINFKSYGNKHISNNINEFYHGTLIAGLIAAKRENNIGIDGISENIKIMPIAISSNGEENDKDIALAIKYATDNGAKVINMSFGKNFSLHKEWVFEAIKYAEKNDVLIVSSAGNSSYNLNEFNNYFPIDNISNNEEISDNFLLVGSSSSSLNKELMSYYSNYGNIDVDLFAPGQKIYTTMPKNKYKFDSGTSLSSAITSGVAALIYSYYPELKASQVKKILMDSGLEFSIEVKTPTKENKNNTTPFNKLSKSGKILNAYNALIMADSISMLNK